MTATIGAAALAREYKAACEKIRKNSAAGVVAVEPFEPQALLRWNGATDFRMLVRYTINGGPGADPVPQLYTVAL